MDDVHVPEVVPLEFEHPHVLQPVKGEARNLDETVFVQLKDPQAFQVDEHLRVVTLEMSV